MPKSVSLVLSLVAVVLGVVAQPARAQQTSLILPLAILDPSCCTGDWWESFRKAANASDQLAKGVRVGVVQGCKQAIGSTLRALHGVMPATDESKKKSQAIPLSG